jgi:hypothetical protein
METEMGLTAAGSGSVSSSIETRVRVFRNTHLRTIEFVAVTYHNWHIKATAP